MSEELVVLRQADGPPVVVRREGLALLWRLEDAGFRFAINDAGRLIVAPVSKLSPSDRAALREYQEDCVLAVTLDPPQL